MKTKGMEKFKEFRHGIFAEFFTKFKRDFSNRENWKLKAAYFFLMSGIVMVWVQLTVHQSALNFTDRDTSDFVSMSTPVTMFTPFLTGMVADKIGNFTKFVATLIILLGMNSICFTLLSPIKMVQPRCNSSSLEALRDIVEMASKQNPSSLEARLRNCFWEAPNLEEESSLSIGDASKAPTLSCKALSGLHSFLFEYIGNRTCSVDACRTAIKTKDPISYSETYWAYFLTFLSFMILVGSCYSLFDGTVMALQQEREVDYGLQRAWGTLAAMISAYLGGFLVDTYSSGRATKDFTLMFFGSGVCFFIAGLITFSISIKCKLPSSNYTKELWRVVRNVEMVALMLVIIGKGVFMCYIETFMYLFMLKNGASSSLIGLTVTVGAAIEIFLQLLATPVTNHLGKVAVISVGILCYAIRFIGLSYIYNPVNILYLEAFDSWGSGFTFTAVNMYCADLASPDTIASVRGLISVLHDGIGKLLGAKIGIEIKDRFGDRNSWRVMSVCALSVAVIYFAFVTLFKMIKKGKSKITKSK